MNYEQAGRLRDIFEIVTTDEQLIMPGLIPGLEMAAQRYVIAFRQTRGDGDPGSGYTLEIPTGCGNAECWARVPLAGYYQVRRVVAPR